MSDISDLEGVFPTALRWNAERGFLCYSVFNGETGVRELEGIEFGQHATFVMDMLTRSRGYGLVKVGIFDMRLTPVGSPPPPFPEDPEFKPAISAWLWSPRFGEMQLTTNAALLVREISALWDRVRDAPQVAEGEQPVIRFTGLRPVPVQAVGKTFQMPVIEIIGGFPRDRVPGWANRAPTVTPPAPLPLLGGTTKISTTTPTAPTSTAPRNRARRAPPKGKAAPKSEFEELLDDGLPEHLR